VPAAPASAEQAERRRYLLAAVVMVVAILGLALAVGFLADDPPRNDQQTKGDTAAKPHIIPRPNSGQAPTQPGDRGGWEQTLVFVVMLGGMVTLAVLAWRSSVRAKRRIRAPEVAKSTPSTSQKEPTPS
jgi:hypothetical protein